MGFLLSIIMVEGYMKTDQEKAKQFFKYNYYQWATPRTLREAMRYSLVKAWRKQTSDVKQSEGAI